MSDGSATFTSTESAVGNVTFQAVATVGASRYVSDPVSVSIVPVKAAADAAVTASAAEPLPALTLTGPATATVGEPFTLTAKLTDHSGSPLSGEPVTLSSSDGNGSKSEATATTGPGGSVSLPVTEDTSGTHTYSASTSVNGTDLESNEVPVDVVVSTPGYYANVAFPTSVDVAQGFTITVTVISKTTNLPASGVPVTFTSYRRLLIGQYWDDPSGTTPGTTDPNGVASQTYQTRNDGSDNGLYQHTYKVTVDGVDQFIFVDVKRVSVSPSPPHIVGVLAAFTYTPLTPHRGQPVAFDGSSSSPAGSISSYSWDFGDGSTGTGVAPTHTYTNLLTRDWIVTLTVSNSAHGWQDSASQRVTVKGLLSANKPPVASFTYPSTSPTPTVSFASTSSDPDGFIFQYQWDFGDGGSTTSATPTHTFTHAGTFEVKLTVTDDAGATDTVSHTVTIQNQPPTADFGFSPDNAPFGTNIQFVDTSKDLDGGHIASWTWDFGDGATSNLQNPTHTFTTSGAHTVTLKVTDDDGGAQSNLAQHVVTVNNQPPTADFGFSPDNAPFGTNIQFVDTSKDLDGGHIASWTWDFGDGATSNLQNPTHTFTTSGAHTVTLKVTDDDGGAQSNLAQHVVTVNNQPPTADFGFSPDNAPFGTNIQFVDTSKDLDGGHIASWTWDFGDGATSNLQNPTHTFTTSGAHTVTLKVTDDDGGAQSNLAQHVVTVNNQPPTADFGFSPDNAPFGTNIQFVDTSKDLDGGHIASWTWDFGDGATSNLQNPTHTFTTSGAHTVTLKVTDDDGGAQSNLAQHVVTVNNQPPIANAGSSQTGVHRGDQVTLDGSRSRDPDAGDTIKTWTWTVTPPTGSFFMFTGEKPIFTPALLGTYAVSLVVTDNHDLSSTNTATTTVTVVDIPPIAVPGSLGTQTVHRGDTVVLTGSATDADKADTSFTYSWSQTAGSTVTLSSATAQNPTFTAPNALGDLTFQLAVDDGHDNSAPASVTVHVVNQAPTAAFTPSTTSALTGDTLTFTSTSSDPDGSIASYSWNFGGGTSTLQNPTHIFAAAGTYTVTLTVTDNDGATSTTASHTVAVASAPVAATPAATPAATATPEPTANPTATPSTTPTPSLAPESPSSGSR